MIGDGVQAGTGDHTATNNSLIVKEMQARSWAKLGLGVAKRTKK